MAITYCKTCLNPSSRPNIKFDENGICPACNFNVQRRAGTIDWNTRTTELQSIADWGRAHSKCAYDCIIAVSGGKDSTRQAFYVRDQLGMKPLLVSCVYPPEQLVDRGAANLANLVSHGFDMISISPNPQVWKQMMREAFLKHANWCKATELPLYAIPIHTAIAYQIPLIFLGENPAFTLGESHGSSDGDASRMKYCNTLQGGDPSALMSGEIGPRDVHFYKYPHDEEMGKANLRIVYLGYYIEDFNYHKNAEFAVAHGLIKREEPPEEIGDITGVQSLDEDFYMVNQYIKYLKFGFGQVTDKVNEAINLGLMNREEAAELVHRYDGACHPRYIEKFCDYIGITAKEFEDVAEACRNPDYWKRDEAGRWVLNTENDL